MVKINLHKKTFEKEYYKELYDYLYDNLNKACTDGNYRVVNAKKLYFKNDKKIIDVLNYIKTNLMSILTSNVKELRDHQKKIKINLGKKYKKTKKTEEYKLYSIVYKIFVLEGYEKKICKHQDKKIAYDIVKDLNITTCPYCNRNHITSIRRTENNYNKVTRPQLDHFISKSKFPFLACSLYNLIPSCSTCNLLKSDEKDDALISPYEIKSNECKFEYKLTKDFQFGKDNLDLIELNIKGDFESNKKAFLLEELYSGHKDVINDILHKTYQHPKEYIKHLYNFKVNGNQKLISMNDVLSSLYSKYLTNEDIHRILFNTEILEKDFYKRPLSKLTYDVLRQLKVLKSVKDS